MGVLTGSAIAEAVQRGDIQIEPFDARLLNPNSYNVRLGGKLIVYKEKVLDVRVPNEYQYIDIPETGLVLEPGRLYLGATVERTKTDKYIPMIEGRSSLARLGLFVHVSAGFGDIGFCGHWTLEFVAAHPIRVYRDTEVAQVYFHTPEGKIERLYTSRKYQNNYGVQQSLSWMDYA